MNEAEMFQLDKDLRAQKLRRSMPVPIDAASEDYPATRDVVVVCGWCPQLHILRAHVEHLETLVVFIDDRNGVSIYRAEAVADHSGYKRLIVSHGICEACKSKHFPPGLTVDETKVKP